MQEMDIRMGVGFKIAPSLTPTDEVSRWNNQMLLDTINIRLFEEMDLLARGRIEVTASEDFHEANRPNSPAGAFTVEYSCDEGEVVLNESTLPIEILIFLNDLSPEQIARFKAEMILGEKRLVGNKNLDEWKENGKRRGNLRFVAWATPEENFQGEILESYFAQTSSLFNEMFLLIYK